MDSTTATHPALTVGTRVRIEKGCKARNIAKGTLAVVTNVAALGAEYGHNVQVTVNFLNGFQSGKTFCFYARHLNRLSDTIVNLNDGNPNHTIQLRRV